MSIAYAFVDGQWLTCTADTFLQVQGRSEREWELILDEWREQQRAHHRKRMSLDSSRLAAFLQEVLTEEALLSQQQRDLEGASIREAIVGQAKTTPIAPSTADSEMDDELDLTTLPTLLEPIPPDLGPYLRLDYYWQMIDALKEHLLVKELMGSVAHLIAAPKATRSKLGAIDWLKMRQVAEQALIRARVKAVFVDEGHLCWLLGLSLGG
jgi:hypothetical protein